MSHYGIRGISNEWIRSYLAKRMQYAIIRNQVSTLNEISTEGLALGHLLFLIYINDLHKCMKYSKIYHFAGDTSIIQSHSSLNKQRINNDLSNLSNWLKANKLSLNIKKTELVLFRSKKLKLDHSFKFKIDGKRIISIHSLKYLGVLLDEHISCNEQVYQIKLKLNRVIGILSKLHSHAYLNTWRIAYYSLVITTTLCGLVVITTPQLHSTKPELRFFAGSNPAHGVSEIRDGEDLWQFSCMETRLNVFCWSTIPQKQFIIHHHFMGPEKSRNQRNNVKTPKSCSQKNQY